MNSPNTTRRAEFVSYSAVLLVGSLVVGSLGSLAGCSAETANGPTGNDATSGRSADAAARSAPGSDAGSPDEVSRTVRLGDVAATVRVRPQPLRLSDEAEVRITVTAPPEVKLNMPPREDGAFPDFRVLDFSTQLPEVRQEHVVREQVYRVEPLRTGTLEIGPFDIEVLEPRADTDGGPASDKWLTTELVQVDVTSLLESDDATLADLAPAETPVDVPRPLPRWILWGLGGLCAALLGAVVWRRWRRRSVPAVVRSPREIALAALDQLLASTLRASDLQQFYDDLSDIVREYIEAEVGIRAPEQTTEEFLRDQRTQSVFSETERTQLRDFLETADLVKFARHRPSEDEIDWSIERAREFLMREPAGVAFSDELVAENAVPEREPLPTSVEFPESAAHAEERERKQVES